MDYSIGTIIKVKSVRAQTAAIDSKIGPIVRISQEFAVYGPAVSYAIYIADSPPHVWWIYREEAEPLTKV